MSARFGLWRHGSRGSSHHSLGLVSASPGSPDGASSTRISGSSASAASSGFCSSLTVRAYRSVCPDLREHQRDVLAAERQLGRQDAPRTDRLRLVGVTRDVDGERAVRDAVSYTHLTLPT